MLKFSEPCKIDVVDGINAIVCDTCLVWYHDACLHLLEDEFQNYTDSPIPLEYSRYLLIET